MASLHDLIPEADRDRINQAVRTAESASTAEIIPVIASSSGRYDRAEDLVGFWTGQIAFWGVWLFLPVSAESGSWSGLSSSTQFACYSAACILGFIAGTVLASHIDALRWLFIPYHQMHEEVQSKARSVFFDQRVHHTQGSSGILIYISVFERQAMILADQSAFDAVGQQHLDELCQSLTCQLKAMSPASALIETISTLGQKLASCLPRTAPSTNELPDALVLMD